MRSTRTTRGQGEAWNVARGMSTRSTLSPGTGHSSGVHRHAFSEFTLLRGAGSLTVKKFQHSVPLNKVV